MVEQTRPELKQKSTDLRSREMATCSSTCPWTAPCFDKSQELVFIGLDQEDEFQVLVCSVGLQGPAVRGVLWTSAAGAL